MITIGITGTGSLIGQAIIKSINNSRYKESRIIGFDYFKETIGSYWVSNTYILPDILKNPNSENIWIETIIKTINKENINIIFIGVDFELNLFTKYKKYIEKETNCIVIVNPKHVIDIADDKYLTYEFLKENNLYYPKSFLPKNIDAAIKSKEITFPLIIKPRYGYRSMDVYKVNTSAELNNLITKVENPIIQEYIGTDQSEYSCAVITLDKKIKGSIALRRDLKDGNTSTTYLDQTPKEIIEYIEDVALKLKQDTICNFQLRLDSNNIPKIFEINARHSGTTFIRSLYGFNEIEYILEFKLKNKEIPFNLKKGTVKRYFEEFYIPKDE